MEFFNNVGKTLTETSQGAVQKTKEMAEIVKLNAALAEENKKIAALQQEIGVLVSDSFRAFEKGALIACLNDREQKNNEKVHDTEVVNMESKGTVWPKEGIGTSTVEMPVSADISGTEAQIRKTLAENGDVLLRIVQIKVCQETITNYQEQISILKGIKKCPHCGGDIPQNAVFCGSCGKKVTEEENKEEQTVGFCTVCGAKVEPDFAFCVNCGQKLG